MKTVKKQIIISLGLVLTVAAANAFAFTGQELTGEAKINLEQARAIALKAYPGKITEEELEHENGQDGLRYSFNIQHDKVLQEVSVDAGTGKILGNAPEGPNAE
jgi:uncharacterized membrane protein YkoI